jgi:uncharacterized protein
MFFDGQILGLDAVEIAVIVAALVMGGVLKGISGAGAPIIAVPVMAALIDLRMAVMVMLVPNLLTSLRQLIQFRRAQPDRGFLWPYLAAGTVGVLAGTWLLAGLGTRTLEILVATATLLYVVFRLVQPAWTLSWPVARRLAIPAGLMAGILQGATGLSAPATLSFLNAVQLSRPAFVATVSALFCVFSVVHIAALGTLGLFTPHVALLSACALVPMLLGMEIGTRLVNRIDMRTFNRVIILLLLAVSVKVFAF